jgi:hypothetical protein
VLGALGLALADRLGEAAARGSAGEALVTLHGRRAGSSIDALARIVGLTPEPCASRIGFQQPAWSSAGATLTSGQPRCI